MQTAEDLSKCEPEVIEQQIEGTRASIAEKIGVLEQEVMGTVESAKQSMQDTVDDVKNAFDVKAKIVARPVESVCGAVLAGAIAGYLLSPGKPEPVSPPVQQMPPPQYTGPSARARVNEILLSALSGMVIGMLREAGTKAFASVLSSSPPDAAFPPEEQPDRDSQPISRAARATAPPEAGNGKDLSDFERFRSS